METFVERIENQKHFFAFLKPTGKRVFQLTFPFLFFLTPQISLAQIDNNFFNGGGIRVGDSTTACPTNGGGIRFDADSSDGGGLQYCDGTNWLSLLTSSFSGVVNNGNSFAAPMIIGTNDTNTLAFETDGTTRMTIDTSGNVGIGTTSPGAKLQIQGNILMDNGGGGANIQVKDGGGTNRYIVGLSSGNVQVGNGDRQVDIISKENAGGFPIRFLAGSTEHMRIEGPTGNVGIGTTAPATTLDINGAESMRGMAAPALSPAGQGRIYFDSTSNTYKVSENGGAYTDLVGGGSGDFLANGTIAMTGQFDAADGDATAPGISFASDEDTGLYAHGANAIGFATGGGTRLVLNDSSLYSNSAIGGSPSLKINGAGNAAMPTYTFYSDSDNGMYRPASDELSFVTGGADRIRIDSSGNVGVGTTAPSAKFQVQGDTNSYNTIDGYSFIGFATGNNIGANGFRFYKNRNGGVVQSSDGIREDIYRAWDGDQYHEAAKIMVQIDGTPGNNDMPGRLTFFTTPDGTTTSLERMRIDNSGNVGLGTTAPATILDINGAESMRGMAAPALSPAGQGRIYFDSTSNTYKVSENNGAYVDLVGGGSGDFMANGSVAMTGPIRMPDGTSGAPSLTFSDDTSTGIYSAFDDIINFSAGGDAFHISDTGVVSNRVMSATYNVAQAYTSSSVASNNPGVGFYLRNLEDATANNFNGIRIRTNNTSSTNQEAYLGIVSNASGETPDIVIGQQTGATAYNERIRINASGNVGVGTTAPGQKLDVEGSILSGPKGVAGGDGGAILLEELAGNGTNKTGFFAPDALGADLLYELPATAPAAGQVLSSTAGGVLSWITAGGGSGDILDGGNTDGADITIGTNDVFDLAFETSGTTRMTILDTGNVGIGTTNPSDALHIVSSGNIRLQDFGGAPNFHGRRAQGTIGSPTAVNSGNVLAALLGSGYDGSSYSGTVAEIRMAADETFSATNQGTTIKFFTTAQGTTTLNENMRIDHNGNVGVGTTAPGQKLDVEGSILSGPKGVAGGDGGAILLEELAGNGTNKTGFFAPDALGADLLYELPAIAPTAGQVLSSTAGGVLSWVTAGGGSGDLLNGGNNGAVTVGSNDNDLTLEANGIDRVTISQWYMGIGTTNPTYALEIDHATPEIQLKDTSNANTSANMAGGLLIRDNGDNITGRIGYLSGDGHTDMVFATNTGTANGGFRWNLLDTGATMVLTEAGRLGIGTATPATSLHINKGQNSTTMMTVSNTTAGTGSAAGIYLTSDATTATIGQLSSTFTGSGMKQPNEFLIEAGGASNGIALTAFGVDPIRFGTTNTERMRIDGAGNVGIGTTAPDTILDINGAESMRGMAAPALSPAGQGRIYFDSTSNTYKVSENNGAYVDLVGGGGGSGDFMADGSVAMTGQFDAADGSAAAPSVSFASDQDLGFYYKSPGVLQFANASADILNFSNNGLIIDGANGPMIRNDGYRFGTDTDTGITHPAADEISIVTANAEAIRIDASGNVGIGTATPGKLLHVQGTSEFEGTMYMRSGAPTIRFYDNSWADSADHFRLRGGANGESFDLQWNDASVPSTDSLFTVLSSGNVGIGTTTPNVALDVNGSIEYTGTITDVSDRRLKEDIKPIEGALETITTVDGVSFVMKGDEKRRVEFGVIAQDVEEVLPELVHTADDEMKSKSVNYVGFIGWIIEAIKDLAFKDSEKDKRILELEGKLDQQVKENDRQNREIESLKALIEEKLK